ncbi:questin oxidase family protein [Labrys neptuniae]
MSAPHKAAGTSDVLLRCIGWSQQWSAEFPYMLANHLPMILVAMHRMGAGPQRLEAFCEIYRVQNGLVPVPEPKGAITLQNWRDFLGDREREGDYRAFFKGEVQRLGATPTARLYLPVMFDGFAASAMHAFMRTAYATWTDNDEETAIALGYWAATYLDLGTGRGDPASTEDPLDVLAYMYGPDEFRHIVTEQDLLWHNMRAVAAKPDFAPVHDMLAIGPDTMDKFARLSLALFAATQDFSLLHALTGTHWLRMMASRSPDPAVPMRRFWQTIASLIPKIGFPDIPTTEQVQEWRRLKAPDWPEIFAEAVQHDDEHDLSLTFSASEEFKLYGDQLYNYVAAKRLGMI